MVYQALILRDAARAAATVREFEKLGITSWCSRLIDAIWPQDTAALSSMAAALRAGSYDWLVLTSATTVAVLHELLEGRPLPQSLKLAVVGAKTAQSARELLGLETDFQPEVQSAAGMAAQWAPPAGARICYPHGDLASSTLGDFLAGLPVQVDEAIAYRTVDAGTPGRPVPGPPAPEHVTRLDPALIGAKLEELDLVVFSAPSIVRRFTQRWPAAGCLSASTRWPSACPPPGRWKPLGCRCTAPRRIPDRQDWPGQRAACWESARPRRRTGAQDFLRSKSRTGDTKPWVSLSIDHAACGRTRPSARWLPKTSCPHAS